LEAEIDWWASHALPDFVPDRHSPTLVPGRFENSLAWECSCGEFGPLHGHRDVRRVYQSHKAHERHALRVEYTYELAHRVNQMEQDERDRYRALKDEQRWAFEDERANPRRRPLDPVIAQMLLDKLI
jgi:hypothetical protein